MAVFHRVASCKDNREEVEKLDKLLPGTGKEAALDAVNDIERKVKEKTQQAGDSARTRNKALDKETKHGELPKPQ